MGVWKFGAMLGIEFYVADSEQLRLAALGDCGVFATSHRKEKGANRQVCHGGVKVALLLSGVSWEKAEVSGSYSFLADFGGVGVLPGLEEGMDDGQLFVGAFIVVNGARPPRTPEFLSQVPNGFRESPAEYRLLKFSIQLKFTSGVGEVASLAALEEGGADLGAGVEGEGVEVEVAFKANFLEEEAPSEPGAIMFVVCAFGLGVVDPVFRVMVEEIQDEISLGRGTI